MKSRNLAAWALLVTVIGIAVHAYYSYTANFVDRGWIGLFPLGMAALFFFDLVRGGAIGIGYWRLPAKPPLIVLILALLIAIGSAVLGFALLFKPLLPL